MSLFSMNERRKAAIGKKAGCNRHQKRGIEKATFHDFRHSGRPR